MRQVFISLIVIALLISVIVTYSGCRTPVTEPAPATESVPVTEEVKEELARLENQIGALREELSDEKEIVNRMQGELHDKSNEIDRLLTDIAEKSRRIEELEAELAELQKPEEEEVTPRVLGVEYYHSKGWRSTFNDYAEEKGWKVIRIDVGLLTREHLEQQGVSILYIPSVNTAYTEEEIEQIVNFVEHGGSLLLVAANKRSLTDAVTKVFGVRLEFDVLDNDLEMTIQPYHPLARDVGTLQLDPSSRFLVVSPPAYDILQPIQRQIYRPIIAAGEFGAGRFVICPDYFDLNAADNSYFLRNVLYWLEQVNLP